MNLQQKKDNSFLATEPLGKLLLKLSLPTVTAQIINMLYNIVDRIYIGHIPENGALALTGVGVCMPLIMIVSAFAALVGNGGAPRASIFMGKGDKESAERTLGNCFTTQIIVSLLLTIILFTGNRSFLMAFGASENTISYAVAYMNIYSLGTIFVQLTLGMNAFITAQGFARTGMLSVLVGAASNIMLDPVFIFVFHMGVRGAALATIISQALSCAWVLSFLTGKKSYLKIRRCNMKLQKNIILPSLALGLSTFIMQASESIISVCFNSSLLKYGGDLAVGAMTILTSAMQFAMLPLQGLGQGAQPIISYNFGAGVRERVIEAAQIALATAVVCGAAVTAVFIGSPRLLVGLFLDPATHAARIAIEGLPWFALGFICFIVNLTAIGYYQSLERVGVASGFALLRGFVFLVPSFLFMPRLCGTEGIWLAMPLSELLTALVILGVSLWRRQRIG